MRHLALLLAAGCSLPSPVCHTRCGITYYGNVNEGDQPAGWTCDALQRLEDQAVDTFRRQLAGHDPRFSDVCRKLPNWRLFTHQTPDWFDEYGRNIAGIARCHNKTMEVGSRAPFRGSLVHELAHVAQDCYALQPVDQSLGENEDHAGWHALGVYRVIEEMHQ